MSRSRSICSIKVSAKLMTSVSIDHSVSATLHGWFHLVGRFPNIEYFSHDWASFSKYFFMLSLPCQDANANLQSAPTYVCDECNAGRPPSGIRVRRDVAKSALISTGMNRWKQNNTVIIGKLFVSSLKLNVRNSSGRTACGQRNRLCRARLTITYFVVGYTLSSHASIVPAVLALISPIFPS